VKLLIVLLILMFSPTSEAVFQQIWKGYQVSKVNQSKLIDKEINEQNYLFEENRFDWQLFVTPTYSHSFPDALFSFQAQETLTTGFIYGVSKSSYKFGTFSFQQQQLSYDLSNWNSAQLNSLPSDQLYETKNTLNYTYDFLDRSSDKDYELTQINYEIGNLESQHTVEKGYYDFFSVYLQAKLQVYAVKLTKDFVKEANKRVRQIQKRVKDGLSRKVELLQARSNLLNQQESLEKARSSLKQNLAIIENLIGQKIDDSYFDQLTWQHHPFSYWREYIRESKNLSVEILAQRLEYAEKTLEKVYDQNGHKLTLSASYETNDFDESSSEALNNSIQGERYNQSLSLTWTIPLGIDKRKGLVRKTVYQKKKNELDLLNMEDEVKVKKEALLEQISFLEKAAKIAKKKVTLGKETLKQQNKLYLRGQASFEEVIRAEESYINARLSEKRLLGEYEMLIANFAYLNNSTASLLNAYKD
jgi:outer membrane protein TolC